MANKPSPQNTGDWQVQRIAFLVMLPLNLKSYVAEIMQQARLKSFSLDPSLPSGCSHANDDSKITNRGIRDALFQI